MAAIERIIVYVTKKEKMLVYASAKKIDQSASEFSRAAIVAAATKAPRKDGQLTPS